MAFNSFMWPCMVLCDLVWSVRPYIAFFTLYGVISMVLHGLLWSHIDFIGLVSSFLGVIDPNSFGLVYVAFHVLGALIIQKRNFKRMFQYEKSLGIEQ